MTAIVESLGRKTLGFVAYLGGLGYLLADGIWWMTVGPFLGRGRLRKADTFLHMNRISLRSMGIVSLVFVTAARR